MVTRVELLGAGITSGEIKQRLASGALIREHRGVYRVGHRAPSVEASYLAAVRACGEDARPCGAAAGHLWGLLKGAAPPPEVIAPGERRVKGVRTHRARSPGSHGDTLCRRIPVTTVARTLVDLSAVLPIDDLARAYHEAVVRHGTNPAQIEAVLARRPSSPGARKLRRIVHGEVPVALSRLEARFIELLGHHGLPIPQTNRKAGHHWVDCRWPEHRLPVELDSYKYHHTRHAWERDRRRERDAHARGDEFRRYTYGDVFEDPEPMLSELRAFFGQPS